MISPRRFTVSVSDEFGQVIAVCFDELVYHLLDAVDIQLAAGVRVEHRGLVNVLALTRDRCFDGEQLDVDIRHIHRRALHGQRTDVAGVDTRPVDETWHLNTCLLGQIGDEMTFVQHVAADLVRRVRDHRFQNAGGILVASRVLFYSFTQDVVVFLAPLVDLFDTATWILVERDVELVDEIRVLGFDVEHIVLGVMLT